VTSGSVNLDVDLDGYYTGSATESGGAFVAMSPPMRVIDTRSSMNGSSIAANSTEKFTIPSSDVPTTATAVAANVTVVPETMNPGFLTIYPTSDSSAPVASDINWTDGMVVPNFTYLPTDGTGSFNAFNNPGGAVNLVADVFGYFAPPVVVPPSVAASNIVVTSPTTPTSTGTAITDNGATETITATVYDGNTSDSTVAGDQVLFTVSPTTGCGTVSPTTTTTNSSGVATTTYTAPSSPTNAASSCTVTASEADYGEYGSETITQSSVPNSVTLKASASSIVAGSSGSITYTATVTPGYSGSADKKKR
jgi:hypothetical protein